MVALRRAASTLIKSGVLFLMMVRQSPNSKPFKELFSINTSSLLYYLLEELYLIIGWENDLHVFRNNITRPVQTSPKSPNKPSRLLWQSPLVPPALGLPDMVCKCSPQVTVWDMNTEWIRDLSPIFGNIGREDYSSHSMESQSHQTRGRDS